MILADSSVWVDYFRGTETDGALVLDRVIISGEVAVGDLVLAEVLLGFATEKRASIAQLAMGRFPLVALGGGPVAIEAARVYRLLRGKGVTVRGTVDLLIGTWCVMNDVPLIHADKDFAGMERWIGLKRWIG
jgi:predicted nucleic acid-binding protein